MTNYSTLCILPLHPNRRDLTYAAFVSKQTLNLSQWNYVGASYNYDTGEASLWHEANKVASQYIGSTQIATQFDVRLGALAMSSLKKYYKGRIACLQFYPEALSPEMIRRAREACKPCKYPSTRSSIGPVSKELVTVSGRHCWVTIRGISFTTAFPSYRAIIHQAIRKNTHLD